MPLKTVAWACTLERPSKDAVPVAVGIIRGAEVRILRTVTVALYVNSTMGEEKDKPWAG